MCVCLCLLETERDRESTTAVLRMDLRNNPKSCPRQPLGVVRCGGGGGGEEFSILNYES